MTTIHSECSPEQTVGVAELLVGSTSGRLTTSSLGSGIGLSVYDPVARVGGLLHFILALAQDREVAQDRPAMFAVSGVSALLRKVIDLGGQRERLVVCAAGGAGTMEEDEAFGIGARNRAMLTKLCWKAGLPLAAEDTGGCDARHMTLDLESGTVLIEKRGEEGVLWRP